MFFGREAELRKLDGIYESGKFECLIIHGRWGVGKTSFLREFLKTKEGIFFSAQETCKSDNFDYLKSSIDLFPYKSEVKRVSVENFSDVFDQLFWCARTERFVFIIDDYQNLVASFRDISQFICAQIDKRLIDSKLMLIICGTAPIVMEKETLSYSSPFHGRRTARLELKPLSFFEMRRHFTGFSPFDEAVIYGVTGGVPRYLRQMRQNLSIEDNIRALLLDPSSFFFDEPANILRREVRDLTYYNAILKAIASGVVKNSEIASAVSLETSACTAYLKNLIALGIVGKHTPMTEKAGKKTVYDIRDSFFRFWYRFLPQNMSLIQAGLGAGIWRRVAQEIPAFMSEVFEDICREWLIQQNEAGALPAKFVEFGRWWGIDPVWKDAATIPIVAYADNNHALFADCTWSDEPVESGALYSLAERSGLFRYTQKHLFHFSRSGFSEECAAVAARIGANLVMFE